MHIPAYISTRIYCKRGKTSSYCFIYNSKTKVEYILKDDMALLWDFIVKNPDYNKVKSYALKNNFESVLDEFLRQLQKEEIIILDNSLKLTKKESGVSYLQNAISYDSENIDYYIKSKNNFLIKNDYIEILEMLLTYNCNLSCKHCCNPKNMGNYKINYEQAVKIIDEAYNLGISTVQISGGECTLNKDFLKIAKYVKSKYLSLTFTTNGQILYDDEVLFNEILKLYPSSVQLSLYSMNPEIHDIVTGVKGSHHKTLSVIKKLKENNIFVNVLNFASIYNKGEHKALKEFAQNMGLGYADTCVFINNPANNNSNVALSENEMEEFYLSHLDFSKNYAKFKKNNEHLCSAGFTRLCVEPNLDIVPCSYNKYILGNYKDTNLSKIKSGSLIKFRQIFTSEHLTECFKEDYCEYCTYCSVHAGFNRGFMKKNEMLCRAAKTIYNLYSKYAKPKN